MDPYLEDSEWSSVHVVLSTEMVRQLAPRVQPKYIVRTARRFVTDIPEDIAVTADDLYLDVSVAEAVASQGSRLPPAIVAPASLQMATVILSRVPHVTIEIRDVAQRELMTAIEILSPTNKRGERYRDYLDKKGVACCAVGCILLRSIYSVYSVEDAVCLCSKRCRQRHVLFFSVVPSGG